MLLLIFLIGECSLQVSDPEFSVGLHVMAFVKTQLLLLPACKWKKAVTA